jgi:DNA-nicking Smr family endonuclease
LVQRSLGERDLQQLREEKIRQERQGSQRVSIRQQIKAHPPPQRQLDLHGCTALQAEQRTEAFVRGALHAGLATVRIIVGKGLHSQGRAVLPDAVAEKLAELKGRGKVLTFQWEKHKKSKSGALIVYL